MLKIQSPLSNQFVPFWEPKIDGYSPFIPWFEDLYKNINKLKNIKNIKLSKLPLYVDERGKIQQIINDIPFSSVLMITSKAGSIRANHFHINDMHVCILTFGKMNYMERPVGSKEKPVKIEINPGDVFLTNKMVEHCMQFVEDSEFWCFAKLSRNQMDYEKDTVKLEYNLEEVYNNWKD